MTFGAEPEDHSVTALRVLIAEDHDDVRAIVVALLSSEFQVVAAVGNGSELVQSATFLQPDVIVTDISMPVMDGFSAHSELRSEGLEYPFVFITMLDLQGLPSDIMEKAVGLVH